MNVDAINSLAWKREDDHRVHETAVPSAVETIFRETALVTSHHPIATARSANSASDGPRVLAKERPKKMRETENPKDGPAVPRVPKFRTKVRFRKLVCLVWTTRKQNQVKKHWKVHRRVTHFSR